MPTLECGSGERLRGLLHRLVEILLVHLQLLGHLLLRLEASLLYGVLNPRLTHENQRRLPGVDGFAELLDVGAGHPLPEVPADATESSTDDGRPDDGGREQDADQ